MTALMIHNLSKTYANGVQALKGIDLTVADGDFFALLGPNGAGKSTTIGIISTIVRKTTGQVLIHGFDINQQAAQAKKQMGLVPQEINCNIFEKVIDVVLYQAGYYGIPYRIAKQRAKYYLNKLALWEKRHSQVRMLSGGMKRRLMIARALMHEPKLLILDEPTAGVDIEIRRSMWDFLRELNQRGTTIILTTHYLEEAESLCRNIAIINHGKIAENTSMKTLLTKLNCETFVCNLAQPLATVPHIDAYTTRLIDDTTLEIDILQQQDINSVFAALSAQNIHVLSMRNKANRLETLFLGLIDKPQPQCA